MQDHVHVGMHQSAWGTKVNQGLKTFVLFASRVNRYDQDHFGVQVSLSSLSILFLLWSCLSKQTQSQMWGIFFCQINPIIFFLVDFLTFFTIFVGIDLCGFAIFSVLPIMPTLVAAFLVALIVLPFVFFVNGNKKGNNSCHVSSCCCCCQC